MSHNVSGAKNSCKKLELVVATIFYIISQTNSDILSLKSTKRFKNYLLITKYLRAVILPMYMPQRHQPSSTQQKKKFPVFRG